MQELDQEFIEALEEPVVKAPTSMRKRLAATAAASLLLAGALQATGEDSATVRAEIAAADIDTLPELAESNFPIVGGAITANGDGYYQLAADGGVFAFGEAPFYGSLTEHNRFDAENRSLVDMAILKTGDRSEYWILEDTGGIHRFFEQDGEPSYEKLDSGINGPKAVSLAFSESGDGWYIAHANGVVRGFGDVRLHGDIRTEKLARRVTEMRENEEIVDMAVLPGDTGYFLTSNIGGVFAFGDAVYLGGMADESLAADIVGIAAFGTHGYRLIGADGGEFSFGNDVYDGSIIEHQPGKDVTISSISHAANNALVYFDEDGGFIDDSDEGAFTYRGRAVYEPAQPVEQIIGVQPDAPIVIASTEQPENRHVPDAITLRAMEALSDEDYVERYMNGERHIFVNAAGAEISVPIGLQRYADYYINYAYADKFGPEEVQKLYRVSYAEATFREDVLGFGGGDTGGFQINKYHFRNSTRLGSRLGYTFNDMNSWGPATHTTIELILDSRGDRITSSYVNYIFDVTNQNFRHLIGQTSDGYLPWLPSSGLASNKEYANGHRLK